MHNNLQVPVQRGIGTRFAFCDCVKAEYVTESGISGIGKISWGSHFCHFYMKPEELISCQVPYLKAGLENKELCYWVTADPLGAKEARSALRKILPDLERHLDRRDINIVDATDSQQHLTTLEREEVEALAAGYKGLRIAGNTSSLSKKDWPAFV